MQMAELKLKDLNDYNLKIIDLNKKTSLIGIPICVEYIENPSRPDIKNFTAFYGLNPITSSNATELYFDLTLDENNIPSMLKDEIREYLQRSKDNINTIIQKKNPNFFDQINVICSNKISSQNSVSGAIIRNLLNSEAKSLLITGLAGYGKTAGLKSVFKDMQGLSLQDFANKYNISEEQAKSIKNFKLEFIPINNEINYEDLMGRMILSQNPKTGEMQTSYENGALLSAIKRNMFLGEKISIGFDELADNERLFANFKAFLMPDINNNYVATATMARDFLSVSSSDISFRLKDNKVVERNFFIFEVAKKCDGIFTCNDEAIEIDNKGGLTVDINKLNGYQANCFLKSITSDAVEKQFFDKSIKDENKKSLDRSAFIKTKINTMKESSVPLLLISEEVANKIRANDALNKIELSSALPYAVSKETFKVFATGNEINQDVSKAALDRFENIKIFNISFDELYQNLVVSKIGVNSKLFNELDIITIDGSARLAFGKAVIDFARLIFEMQRSGELMMPEYDGNKEPAYKAGFLSSPTLNPRLITNIVNQSETPKDILDNYSRYAEQILGIEGLPAEFDINEIAVFNEALQNKLAPELSKICKKYGIKDNIGDIAQNNLLQALPKIEIKNSQVIEHVSAEPDENTTVKMKP
jgi:hypothetical protein